MNFKRAIMLCLVFAGCSPYKTLVGKAYRGHRDLDAKLAIAIVDTIQLAYAGRIGNDLGPDTGITAVSTYVNSQLRIDVMDSTCFRTVRVCTLDRSDLSLYSFPYGRRDTVLLRIPAQGTILDCEAISADYVLILTGMKIESAIHITVISLGLLPFAAVPSKPIHFSATFAIWDNRKGRLVAYGRAKEGYAQGMYVDRRAWDIASANFAQAIFKRTPFYHWNYH